MDDILNLKPNVIIGDFKEGILSLDAWKYFKSRQGPYCPMDSNEKSNGTVKGMVSGCTIDYVRVSSQAQIDSIKYLVDNSFTIRDEILKELLNALPDLSTFYGNYLPDIRSAEDVQNHIGLSIVHVMNSDKDEFAYVGFEFGCTWDEEHGLGVMTHRDRIIAIGQADKSFDIWPTYSDNGTEIQMTRQLNQVHINVKKSWWKFWN
jgi:hypothetical protein